MTTYYALDQAAPLTQVLSDGTNDYLYGLDRIAQVNGSVTEYFLTDALGSVRQLADNTGAVTLAKSYQPYGTPLTATGSGASIYGFTGEQQDPTGLTYLRARYYSSTQGRFISRDTWDGNANQPMSFNRWLYTEGNPVNFVDPSGRSKCYNSQAPECVKILDTLYKQAKLIKQSVSAGSLMPVEGFARFVDITSIMVDYDIRDLVWGITIILDDMDANRGPIWRQAGIPEILNPLGSAGSPYFIQEDWLPYGNDKHPELDWGYSTRGDWNKKYWDKTANQAYHFWFLVAVTFFDGGTIANVANIYHEYINDDDYSAANPLDMDFDADPLSPPQHSGRTIQDFDLGVKGIQLGLKLSAISQKQEAIMGDPRCTLNQGVNRTIFSWANPAGWIRSNLK